VQPQLRSSRAGIRERNIHEWLFNILLAFYSRSDSLLAPVIYDLMEMRAERRETLLEASSRRGALQINTQLQLVMHLIILRPSC
jgi:hypothetical protein